MHADACIAFGHAGATYAQGCCETHQAEAELPATWDCSKASALHRVLPLALAYDFRSGVLWTALEAFSTSPPCLEHSSAAADGLSVPLPTISAGLPPRQGSCKCSS